MSCDHCVRSVSTELLAVKGVSDVAVDLATGVVRVTSAAPLSNEQVADAIDEAGYELVGASAN
jgi:copper chaperone CopZ